MITLERRCELLASADRQQLLAVADACLDGQPAPEIILAPQVGSIVLTVREPVEATRFHLGDVLVTRAEVEHRGERGWSMLMGADEPAALAAAICAAEAQADGPAAQRIDELCAHTERTLNRERAAEWEELTPTIVSFKELEA